MPDSPQRDELYRKAERMIVQDYPAAFLIHGVNYVLLHDWLQNYKSNVFAYGTSKYRRIDLNKRASLREQVNGSIHNQATCYIPFP